MATILDIAKEAGYSKTLVSRALNDQKGVSQEARKKILDAAKELGYRPNMLAKSLVLKKTFTIGVVLDNLSVNQLFDLIRGLQDCALKNDYNIMFCSSNGDMGIKKKYMKYFAEGRCDGVVVYGNISKNWDIIKNITATGFPFVSVENDIDFSCPNNISIDYKYGIKLAVEHLIEKKCKNFVCLTYENEREGKSYFFEACRNHFINVNENNIIYSDLSEISGYENTIKLINSGNLPDGIIFSKNVLAFGAIRALYENNLLDKIEMISMEPIEEDNMPYFPNLLAIKPPMYDIGVRAINLLLDNIENQSCDIVRITVRPEIYSV